MDTPKQPQKAAPLLDELESIRKLLGDDTLQPPLLTETVASEGQIPLLFDMVGKKAEVEAAPEVAPPVAAAPTPAPTPIAEAKPEPAKAGSQDTLLHLDSELRAAAQLIMQDVIDDFAPHIETEIKRRLDARMERLLSQYPS
ncbi:DNA polymerase III subunit chi [Pseudomonas gingeri]|uniref:DNA polymerase III subunit chi n=1 Tax=Pseudomonas gingeri TaxID=117681 RepID=A0A7Y7Y9T9_9PSED|nr:DNA polymerase III subunit chi [Pseudomonas gingeri]NWA03237.1 DNA polymerase III subunit chi [Pseudomonas gingeri]NWA18459.1 DNA polymerase III subunit chi [Pseudomonas gingeri]NWA53278.1 DNA polymerase III subunit chi [Pseudomonas gingeri]NWA98906.1 DNA polymerase III subunit chi [Pseudomonas gingeri]NWB02240.1 DNA polymerase III subunit chi [Pseudomonas gingeri]